MSAWRSLVTGKRPLDDDDQPAQNKRQDAKSTSFSGKSSSKYFKARHVFPNLSKLTDPVKCNNNNIKTKLLNVNHKTYTCEYDDRNRSIKKGHDSALDRLLVGNDAQSDNDSISDESRCNEVSNYVHDDDADMFDEPGQLSYSGSLSPSNLIKTLDPDNNHPDEILTENTDLLLVRSKRSRSYSLTNLDTFSLSKQVSKAVVSCIDTGDVKNRSVEPSLVDSDSKDAKNIPVESPLVDNESDDVRNKSVDSSLLDNDSDDDRNKSVDSSLVDNESDDDRNNLAIVEDEDVDFSSEVLASTINDVEVRDEVIDDSVFSTNERVLNETQVESILAAYSEVIPKAFELLLKQRELYECKSTKAVSITQ